MNITDGILEELRKQSEKQLLRNYKGVEVDARTLLQLLSEIDNSRLIELHDPLETAMPIVPVIEET